MNHNFLLKNSLNKNQLDLKNTLFHNFKYEIHLGKEIESMKDINSMKRMTELGDLILDIFEKTPIKVIHTPLTKTDNFYIEQKNTQDIFPYIVKTAEYIRKQQGYFKEIIVVVHNQLTVNEMDAYNILHSTVQILQSVADKYPNVKIAIENTVYSYNVFDMNYFTNLDLALFCNRNNIGTCLDVCHVKMNQYIDNIMQSYYQNISIEKIPSIYKFIYTHMNFNKLFLIHFANAKNDENGFGKDFGHGAGFFANNIEDVKFAKNILFAYDKYKCTCPLTLELIEEDYMKPINLKNTIQLLNLID